MSPDQGIAVLIDENLTIGGEVQIKKQRHRGKGVVVELTVWEPTGGQYPHAKVRVRGNTVLETLDNLEKRLNGQAAKANDIGDGHSWSGTAHTSTSSRTD